MRAALTAKTFISILSQSNEKVATRKGGSKGNKTKRHETIRNECYRQSIFTQAALKYRTPDTV